MPLELPPPRTIRPAEFNYYLPERLTDFGSLKTYDPFAHYIKDGLNSWVIYCCFISRMRCRDSDTHTTVVAQARTSRELIVAQVCFMGDGMTAPIPELPQQIGYILNGHTNPHDGRHLKTRQNDTVPTGSHGVNDGQRVLIPV